MILAIVVPPETGDPLGLLQKALEHLEQTPAGDLAADYTVGAMTGLVKHLVNVPPGFKAAFLSRIHSIRARFCERAGLDASGPWKEARKFGEEAFAACPEQANVTLLLVRALTRLGDWPAARKVIARAREVNPNMEGLDEIEYALRAAERERH